MNFLYNFIEVFKMSRKARKGVALVLTIAMLLTFIAGLLFI